MRCTEHIHLLARGNDAEQTHRWSLKLKLKSKSKSEALDVINPNFINEISSQEIGVLFMKIQIVLSHIPLKENKFSLCFSSFSILRQTLFIFLFWKIFCRHSILLLILRDEEEDCGVCFCPKNFVFYRTNIDYS